MSSPLLLHPIGVVRSPLRTREEAPKHGDDGTPVLDLEPPLDARRER